MNDATIKWAKGVGGLIVLAAVFFTVMSFIGNAREDLASREAAKQETEATPTAEPAADATKAEETPAPAAGAKPSEKVVIVAIDGLNFRKEPAQDAPAIRGLAKGDRLTYLGTKDGWYQVQDLEGVKGYVSANKQYTKLENR